MQALSRTSACTVAAKDASLVGNLASEELRAEDHAIWRAHREEARSESLRISGSVAQPGLEHLR